MIPESDLTKVDTGSGYFIGEIQTDTHPELTYLRRGAIVTLFDGVDTALSYIYDNLKVNRHYDSSEARGRGGFNAFESYDDAMTTFRNKPESVVQFDPSELRIKDASEAGTSVEYDVTGDYIDMGRFMEGIPETWGAMHNGNARNRRVNIVVNLNQMWRIDHSVITHRGERVLRLVDALEAGGVRCRLVGIESSECNHTEIVIKHHDEPLTISDLAVVTHPEFLRRAIFRIVENSKTVTGGYGNAVRFGELLKPEMIDSGSNEELDIVIDGNFDSNESVDRNFNQLERLLVWEMSKTTIEVASVKVSNRGLYFNPNGARSSAEIKAEGMEVIKSDDDPEEPYDDFPF